MEPHSRELEDKLKRMVVDTYTQIAEHFDKTRHQPWPATINFVKTIRPGSTVADLGCGNGRDSVYLAQKGFRVLAVDATPAMLKVARRRAAAAGVSRRIRFIPGDVSILPLEDEVAHAAIYVATLQHLPSESTRSESVRELHRVLKPGGKALIGVWAREQERFLSHLEAAQGNPDLGHGDILYPWHRQPDGTIFHRYLHLYDREELDHLIARSPLHLVKAWDQGGNHYALVRK